MNITFERILQMLEKGYPIRRACWPKDEFIFRQVPADIPIEIVPGMQSLPEKVKEVFLNRASSLRFDACDFIHYKDQIAKVNRSNFIQSFSFSNADIFAEDWQIYRHS